MKWSDMDGEANRRANKQSSTNCLWSFQQNSLNQNHIPRYLRFSRPRTHALRLHSVPVYINSHHTQKRCFKYINMAERQQCPFWCTPRIKWIWYHLSFSIRRSACYLSCCTRLCSKSSTVGREIGKRIIRRSQARPKMLFHTFIYTNILITIYL